MADESGSEERDSRKAWNDVGERFTDLGRRLGQHYRQQAREDRAAVDPQRKAMNEAFLKAVDQLDQAFTSVGDALRDPATKQSMSEAVRSLGDALGTTFQNLSDEVGRRVRGKGTGGGKPGDESRNGP